MLSTSTNLLSSGILIAETEQDRKIKELLSTGYQGTALTESPLPTVEQNTSSQPT